MTFAQSLSWINTNVLTPLFNFQIPFWGSITFGAVIVGIFGIPILVRCYKKFF